MIRVIRVVRMIRSQFYFFRARTGSMIGSHTNIKDRVHDRLSHTNIKGTDWFSGKCITQYLWTPNDPYGPTMSLAYIS